MERQKLFERKCAYFIKQNRRTQEFVAKWKDSGNDLNLLLESYEYIDSVKEGVKCITDSPKRNTSVFKH